MTTKILGLTDAPGNLVGFVLLPGHRFDTAGVAALIKDLSLGGLIADMAFDSNVHYCRPERAGRQDRDLPALKTRVAPTARYGDLQMASPDRKLLLRAQGVQTHRDASRQTRSELQRHPPRRRRHKLAMNLNTP
jgi:hypothetical protein